MTTGRVPRALVFAFVASLMAGLPATAQTSDSPNVLTIHAGAVDYAPNPVLDAGIRDALLSRAGPRINYFTEYLEFDRFASKAAADALSDYIARKYQLLHIDVVIAVTNRSLAFVLEHRAALFPDASIVFAAVGTADQALIQRAGTPITGIKVGNAFAETAAMALRLHPSTKRMYVIAIAPSDANVRSARAELHDVEAKVPLTYLEAASLPELLEAVRRIPRGSVVLYLWYQQQGPEYLMDPMEPARKVAEASAVPVYGVIDANVGTGIVGGMVRDVRATGDRVGQAARKILDGVPASAIPMSYAPLVPIVDWRQLRRWGIDTASLPRSAEIRFREPTFWQQYRTLIVGAVVVFAAQLMLIVSLLTQRASRRRAERSLRHSFDRIRYLAGRLINAQEKARADIARDLHDDVCQDLVGVSISVDNLMRTSGRVQDRAVQEELTSVRQWTLDIVENVRQLSHDLHPANLNLLGLAAALRAHCVEVERRHDVQVAFTTDGNFRDLPKDVAVSLFRIAQEALRNAAVHGNARRLTVSLSRIASELTMSVVDDGIGFDPKSVRKSGGLGLISIEERVHAIGGDVQVTTAPRRGTTIVVHVSLTLQASTPAASDSSTSAALRDGFPEATRDSLGARSRMPGLSGEAARGPIAADARALVGAERAAHNTATLEP